MERVVGLYRIIAPHSAVTHFILLTQNCRSFCSVLLRRSVSLTLHFSLRKILRTHINGFSPSHTQIKKMITNVIIFFMGRVVGFEPTHNGTTIRGLNHLTTPAICLLFNTITKIFTIKHKKSRFCGIFYF